MSSADHFDRIATRAWADTDSAVQKYHEQLRAITERLRVSSENTGHRRGVTREALADYQGVLLPAEDIDLSPHTPVPAAAPPAAAIAEARPIDDGPDDDPGFSFSSGWLSDR